MVMLSRWRQVGNKIEENWGHLLDVQYKALSWDSRNFVDKIELSWKWLKNTVLGAAFCQRVSTEQGDQNGQAQHFIAEL